MDELVGTILSQNTTDVNSSRAFRSLRSRFWRWEDVLVAPTSEVARAIWLAGLANTKAPRIQAILRQIKAERGRLSLAHLRRMNNAAAMNYLLSLHGVGPKTAACVLLFGMGRDIFPVDTHIHRLCRRLGIVSPFASAEQTQEQMAGVIPKGGALSLHINLIRHGRRICRAQRPRCAACVLASICPWARDIRPASGCD
ncbi:MAG: endonuclease III [Verrucomicrobia bacterium]|nr:endonuclease III [Verrucomicrobiota bacterium]